MKVKMNEIPERTPEQRHKDNLHILAVIQRHIDNLEWNLEFNRKSKENIIKTYLYDYYDLDKFYEEFNEYKRCEQKRKEFMEKYQIYGECFEEKISNKIG